MSLLIDKLKKYGADTDGAMERLVDDEELYEMCLMQFVEDPGFQGLTDALAAKDYTQAFDQAHALKGVAGNLGLTPLFDSLSGIVEPLRANDYSNLDAQKADVDAAYEVYKDMIADIVG